MQDAGRGGFGRADASRPWGISQRRVEALASRGLQSCVCADATLRSEPMCLAHRRPAAWGNVATCRKSGSAAGSACAPPRWWRLCAWRRTSRWAFRSSTVCTQRGLRCGWASVWQSIQRRRRRPTTRACSPIAAAPRMRRSPPRYSAVMLTATFGPVMFGSQRELLAAVVRALPDPDSAAPVRAIQIARRLPKAAKYSKPHMVALCEVGEMLAERLGLPSSVQGLFVTLTERWDGKGQLRRAQGGGDPVGDENRQRRSRRRPPPSPGRRGAGGGRHPRARRRRVRPADR